MGAIELNLNMCVVYTTMDANELNMYVVYNKPKDFPNNVVVRRWIILAGQVKRGDLIGVADDLEKARLLLPEGLHNLGRYMEDDPCIEEVWI